MRVRLVIGEADEKPENGGRPQGGERHGRENEKVEGVGVEGRWAW